MRNVIIVVRCDVCDEEIQEDTEGESSVIFSVYGTQREMDICPDCLRGTFLQEARPLKTQRKTNSKDFVCGDCGKAYGTQRGLSRHRGVAHKDNE